MIVNAGLLANDLNVFAMKGVNGLSLLIPLTRGTVIYYMCLIRYQLS